MEEYSVGHLQLVRHPINQVHLLLVFQFCQSKCNSKNLNKRRNTKSQLNKYCGL